MAIALDVATAGQDQAGSLAWSHTCTGSNLALFVSVVEHGSTTDHVSAVTYGGVAMTLLATQTWIISDPSGGHIKLYWLQAPATGTNTVAVTATGSVETGGYSISYTGVKQTGSIDSVVTQTDGVVNSITVTTTTIANNCWTILSNATGCVIPSAGTGSTFRVTGQPAGFDSNGAITPAGSHSMSLNTTGVCIGGTSIMASFAPAVSAVANSGFFFAATQ